MNEEHLVIGFKLQIIHLQAIDEWAY